MNKVVRVSLLICSSFLIINWSKNLSSPEYCSGLVNLYPNGQETVIDIKIGSSKAVADNRDIIVYRKPTSENVTEKDLIEYHIDLKRVSKIETDQVTPVSIYDKKEYVNIKVASPSNISVDCVIPKSHELICKLKNTGWTASYPFNRIKEVIIHHCAEIQETCDDTRKSKEVAVNDLKRAVDELEKHHQHDRKIKDLKHRADNVLEDIKNSVKE